MNLAHSMTFQSLTLPNFEKYETVILKNRFASRRPFGFQARKKTATSVAVCNSFLIIKLKYYQNLLSQRSIHGSFGQCL
jgi:hypothetical protein